MSYSTRLSLVALYLAVNTNADIFWHVGYTEIKYPTLSIVRIVCVAAGIIVVQKRLSTSIGQGKM